LIGSRGGLTSILHLFFACRADSLRKWRAAIRALIVAPALRAVLT
jgi:hypothetical protein